MERILQKCFTAEGKNALKQRMEKSCAWNFWFAGSAIHHAIEHTLYLRKMQKNLTVSFKITKNWIFNLGQDSLFTTTSPAPNRISSKSQEKVGTKQPRSFSNYISIYNWNSNKSERYFQAGQLFSCFSSHYTNRGWESSVYLFRWAPNCSNFCN